MGKRTSKKPLIIGIAVMLAAAILLGILLIGKANNPDPIQPTENKPTSSTNGTNNATTPSGNTGTNPYDPSKGNTDPTSPTETDPTDGTEPSNPGPVMDPDDIIPDDPDVGIQIPSSTSNE